LGVSLQCAGISCFNGQWMGAFSALVMALSWKNIIWCRRLSEHGHNIISKWWERWWACSNCSDVDIFTPFVQYGTFLNRFVICREFQKIPLLGGCGLYVQLNSHTNHTQTNRPIQFHESQYCGQIWPSQSIYKWKTHQIIRIRNNASTLLYKIASRLSTIHHLIFTNKKCKSAFKFKAE
jgi:hypothetical protein